jgi:hypothetical protein
MSHRRQRRLHGARPAGRSRRLASGASATRPRMPPRWRRKPRLRSRPEYRLSGPAGLALMGSPGLPRRVPGIRLVDAVRRHSRLAGQPGGCVRAFTFGTLAGSIPITPGWPGYRRRGVHRRDGGRWRIAQRGCGGRPGLPHAHLPTADPRRRHHLCDLAAEEELAQAW